jgi:pimeloyl-ACP methyl ester carboxylesterase
MRVSALGFACAIVAAGWFACGLRPAAAGEVAEGAQTPVSGEHVVLVHGLGRTTRAMQPLAERLGEAGYTSHNLAYPSRTARPEALLAELTPKIESCCAGAKRLHFVGHSLGGILIRAYLANGRPSNLGRVVMLSPPNHGSVIVDKLGATWLFEAVMGPTAETLGTGPDSFPNSLPQPDYEVGIIAATDSINPFGSWLIPGDDDGMVSVCSMRLEGMADFVTVDHTHAFVMRAEDVARQTIAFLQTGRFQHPAAVEPFDGEACE